MTSTPAQRRHEGRRLGLFLVLVVGAAQVSATALGIGTPVQPMLSILFVLTCPGFLLFDLEKPTDVSARLLIAIGASLSINLAIATVVLVAEARWIAPVFALVLVAVAALPQERLRDAVTRVGSFMAGVAPAQLALPTGSDATDEELDGVPVADSSAIVEPDELEGETLQRPDAASPANDGGDGNQPVAGEGEQESEVIESTAESDETTGRADATTSAVGPDGGGADALADERSVAPEAAGEAEHAVQQGDDNERSASETGAAASDEEPPSRPGDDPDDLAGRLEAVAAETAAPEVTTAAEVGVGEVPELARLEVPVLDAASASPAVIDLNTADAKALQALPGVGPKLATAIVDHRKIYGPFETFTDLLDVPGIGPGKVRRLPDRATVAPAPAAVPEPAPPRDGQEEGAGAASFVGAAAPTAPPPEAIDINRASATALRSLPGVGPSLARRIVAHRDLHGPFRSLEDLQAVSGLGRTKTQDLDDHIVFGHVAMNINTATAAQLARVDGIGLELGSRIVSHRVLHGEFASVDRLVDVSGIGPAKLEALRPSLTV